MPRVSVSRRARQRILRGHAWIYRSDVRRTEGVDNGAIVEVFGPRDELLGRAFFSRESEIRLRMITFGDEPVDEALWRRRLEAALERRRHLFPGATTYRWVHAEADGLPALVVDRYGDVLVVQTLAPGTERLTETLVPLWVELARPKGILARNDQKVRALEGLPLVKTRLWGEVPDRVEVDVDGVRFLVDPWGGQKTGLFLDQRENHAAAERYARGRALDLFAYDGGFALRLARAAERVVAVDTSEPALARLRANAEANGLANVETVEANVFDFLRALDEKGERFDTITLDPPAFAKNRASVPQARRGYKEINLRALKILRPGGHLVTSSCSYHLSETDFVELVAAAAADARARLVLVEKRTQARDHPILLAMPETHYLKCLVLRRLDESG